ncbi:MAG: transglycosylase SLT domain-containing protein [Tannerellaceae bacterium]|nr:transglycosylase SLT domain-containing protein [Tannerellaceae bacterium]
MQSKENPAYLYNDSFPDEIIPESIEANLDSLLNTWHAQYFTQSEDYCYDEEENVHFNDEIIRERLARLPHIIPMTYNNMVRNSIDFYTNRKRNLIRYMLGMADFYFPIIEPILDEYGLPIELKYLAVVESALNPIAISRVGACGLWQFMLPTGKSYGLQINSLIDERRDPVSSTRAACMYFKDMYNLFNGDWNLVIAAYNCGPGNINKAIRRAGGATNFWHIYPYLPRETRSYVPLFIAACYVMNYYCDHNICPMRNTIMPLATDTVMLNKAVPFQKIADFINIDINMLRTLNPQYKRDIVPGNVAPSVLKLPILYSSIFIEKIDSIYDSYDRASLVLSAKQQQITHIVQKGENLVTIADKYGVTAKDIRRWNSLSSNRVSAGRKLRLTVNNGGFEFSPVSKTTVIPHADKPQINNPLTGEKTNSTQELSLKIELPDKFITYTVKSGDSLYSISKNAGVSIDILQRANKLTGTNIREGQKILIPKG